MLGQLFLIYGFFQFSQTAAIVFTTAHFLLDDPHLLEGLNVHRGMVTYKDVARDLGYDYVPAAKALETD